jgi:hypothetical protein
VWGQHQKNLSNNFITDSLAQLMQKNWQHMFQQIFAGYALEQVRGLLRTELRRNLGSQAAAVLPRQPFQISPFQVVSDSSRQNRNSRKRRLFLFFFRPAEIFFAQREFFLAQRESF